MDDLILAQAAAGGDEKAFSELAIRYRPYIYTVAYKVVLNVEDALDVTQNVLVLMARKMGSYRGEGSLRAWLATMATREAISFLRHSSRRESAMPPEEMLHHMEAGNHGTLSATQPDAVRMLEKAEQRQMIEQVLPQLSAQQRAIFALLFYEEMRPKEISEKLGIPNKQVSMQLHRAMQKMKQWLGESGENRK